MLVDGQVQVRDLVMGDGTPFELVMGFNPFNRPVRADQQSDRPWSHGSVSGAEWAGKDVLPIYLHIDERTTADWMARDQQVAAAFSAAGDSTESDELRFAFGGREYVMFGRARGVDQQQLEFAAFGRSVTVGLFAPLDPRIYDGTVRSGTIGLPTFEGGLTAPLMVPFTVDATPVDGQADLVNEGTVDTGLQLVVAGPVEQPRVTLQRPDGVVQTLRYLGDVPSGRTLHIDTRARTVLVDGLPQASRRDQVAGDWPMLPGSTDGYGATSTLLFRAQDDDAAGTLSWSARSAWW